MFVVTLAITLVTELVLNKRGDQIELDADEQDQDDEEFTRSATPQEKRGMWIALATLIGCFVLLTALAWPRGSFLRDAEGGFSTDSGLMAGIAAIVGFGFFLVGIAYGVAVGRSRRPRRSRRWLPTEYVRSYRCWCCSSPPRSSWRCSASRTWVR